MLDGSIGKENKENKENWMILFDVKPFLRPFGKASLLLLLPVNRIRIIASRRNRPRYDRLKRFFCQTPLCPQNEISIGYSARHTNK